MLPIYVINLDKDVNRWKDIKKEFRKAGIFDYTRINAVYGKDLSDDQIKENTTLMCQYTCTYPMIGIGMSHLKTWETFLASGKEMALIFEDDVELVPNFREKLLTKLNSVPNDADLIYVGCNMSNYENSQTSLIVNLMKLLVGSREKLYKKINNDVYIPSLPLGLHAYIITRECAKKLIEKFKGRLANHIDYQLLMEGEDLKVYALNPNLASQKKTLEDSNNILSTFPRIINEFLNVNDEDNEPLSYKFSIPIAQIAGYPINALNIFLFLIAIVLGLFSQTFYLFIYLISIYLFLEFIIKPECETVKYDLYTFILLTFGFWIGMSIKSYF